jgi:hypothetical protein
MGKVHGWGTYVPNMWTRTWLPTYAWTLRFYPTPFALCPADIFKGYLQILGMPGPSGFYPKPFTLCPADILTRSRRGQGTRSPCEKQLIYCQIQNAPKCSRIFQNVPREQRFFFSLLKFRPKTKYYIYVYKIRK